LRSSCVIFRVAVGLVLTLLGVAVGSAVAGAQSSPAAQAGAKAASSSRTSIDEIIDTLASTHRFIQVSISPDGKRVAWVELLGRESGMSAADSAISVADLGSNVASEPRRISAGHGGDFTERDLAWSADSSKLAFLSDAAKRNQRQLYVVNMSGGAVRQLTHVTGHLSSPRWSPDGKSLAVLFTANAPRVAGPLEPMTPDAGVVEEQIFEQRICVVDAATGNMHTVSPADMYVYEYDWSPDGKNFTAIAAHGSGDNNWWIAQLYTLPSGAASGANASGSASVMQSAMQSILKPQLQIAVPRWSPDGKFIAYIGGLMSDQGSTGGDVYIVPAGGGAARNLTPGIKASPSWITWRGPNQILFVENVNGNSDVATVDIASGNINTLWSAAEHIAGDLEWGMGLSLAASGNDSAVARSSSTHPPEIWAGAIGQWQPVTRLNSDIHALWGESRSVHWMSHDLKVQGWLDFPRDYDAARKYPLVVDVHGGPAAACTSEWRSKAELPALSNLGYFVLCPNPRGSYGQGESFTQANVKDFGYGDFGDIMAGVEQVSKDFPIDRERVGIMGWSYGGYMAMWAVTQTQRFRAAVAGAGLSDWLSYYGENDIDQWMVPYFGATVYDDPKVYERSSPITFIKNVKTPTLIVVGDRDGEVPAPQSYEFWHALKTLGVETQLVVYPNEGHRISQPEHVRDLTRRTVGWFDDHMPAKAAR
jgi:dipeptidyl aminopeptidase/acylaminoacyl peptidase